MNATLAAMYNTNGYGDRLRAEQEKIASLDLFAKTAAANNIDLSQLSSDQQTELYNEFVTKLAEEGGEAPPEEKREEEREEEKAEDKKEEHKEESEGAKEEEKEAQAQFRSMKEWQEKCAEADHLGRRMAHAFWDESGQIEKAAAEWRNLGSSSTHALAHRPKEVDLKGAGKGVLHAVGEHLAKHKGKYVAGGLAAGTAAGVAAGVNHLRKLHNGASTDPERDMTASEAAKKKEASAFDWQAAKQAVKIAAAANWDTDQAATRLESLLTLGVPSMDKTAAALDNYDSALNVRALELLEGAGYSVDWAQVFGK